MKKEVGRIIKKSEEVGRMRERGRNPQTSTRCSRACCYRSHWHLPTCPHSRWMGRSSDSSDSTLSRCPQCPWCARQPQAFRLAWALSHGSPGLESPWALSPGFLASVLWHLQIPQDKLGNHRTGRGRRCTKIPSASPQSLKPGR